MNNKSKNQDPISQQDLWSYLSYVLSGEVKDEKHAKDLTRLARRTTTLSDVTVVFKMLQTQTDRKIVEVMDVVQIQNKLLKKLGVTEEMVDEANKEYNEVIEEARKELEAQAEAMKKETEGNEV